MESSIKLCCICKEKQFKYKCPGCLMITCSVECINIHKVEFDCDGKQSIQFKKIDDFDDKQFFKDFEFLEEGSRLLDCSIRGRKKIIKNSDHIPAWARKLVFAARKRGTRLILLPGSFEKRIKNQTNYIYNKELIRWDVGLVFTHITEKGTVIEKPSSLVLNRVDENKTLGEILTDVINPKDILERHDIWKLLTCYRLSDESKFLILLFTGKKFHQIDGKESLNKALQRRTIIEYPTFIITFNEFKDRFPIVAVDETSDIANTLAEKNFFGNNFLKRKMYFNEKRKQPEELNPHIEPKVAKKDQDQDQDPKQDQEPPEGNPIPIDCNNQVCVDPILPQSVSDVSSLSASDDEDYQKFLNIGFARQSTGI
ncbi:box C/D snoRNA protein 1-like [Panonychus citri]|uniref:box C/D snoRNA protein 1-like n=1 Tax=Panonychus citri TaxID=50023 RepID=UPI002307CDD1|nr:box C/D snoRNA protein 1-like [Panonychus citri]